MENFNFLFGDDDWDDEEEWDDEEDFFDFDQIIGNAQEQETENLSYILNDQTVKQLRLIAQRRGWTLKGNAKNDIVEQMTEHMFNALEQPNFLKGLTAEEHELLAIINTLFNINNTIGLAQIQHIWANALERKKSVKPILAGLETYGLIYECREHGSSTHYHPFMTLPIPLLPVYPIFPTRKVSITQQKEQPAPPNFLQQFEQFGGLLAASHTIDLTPNEGEISEEGHELFFVGNWPYLPQDVDKLPKFSPYLFFNQKQNYLTVPLRKHLLNPSKNKALINTLNNAFKADWFTALAMQMQILVIDSENHSLAYFNPEPWSMILSLPSQERLQFLFTAWESSFLDLSEIRKLLAQNSKISIIRQPDPELPYQAFLFDNMLAKQTILRVLRAIAEDDQQGNEWLSFEQLLEDFYMYYTNVHHPLTANVDWGFKDGNRVLSPENRRDWFASYGKLIEYLFSGALYWLNIVSLQKTAKGIHAFRLTTTGKALLSPQFGLDHIAETTSPGEVIWLNGRTAKVAPGYEVNAFLGLITHLATAVPKEPFTYTLAPEQIEQAFIGGETPATLNRLFMESGWRLPEEGYSYIEELYGRFGKTHIYDDLTLIEFNDDHALRELEAADILKGALVYEFSPRLIAIKPEMVVTVIQRLEKRNYTPRTIEGGK